MANNGVEGAMKYTEASGDFALIFMDVQMPEMDGMEATRVIRKWESQLRDEEGRVPIIALTAHAMKGDKEMCLEAGMDEYITKPLKKKYILEMLDRWVVKNGIEKSAS